MSKPHGTIEVTLEYAGRSKPIPVDESEADVAIEDAMNIDEMKAGAALDQLACEALGIEPKRRGYAIEAKENPKMKQVQLTVQAIMRLCPCEQYPEERVRELWAGRESLTPLEILDLYIPAKDQIWVMCQDGVLPSPVIKLAMDAIVTRAVRNYALPHPATKTWAEKWLSGEDRTAAAAWAAWEAEAKASRSPAAWAAEAAASWVSVWTARTARVSVEVAASAVAASAATAAAWAARAARAARAADEYESQVEDFRQAITSGVLLSAAKEAE